MTLNECEDIARILKARARIDAQHGTPAADTLSGKAAEAIEWLMAELAADGWREEDAWP